MVRSWEGEIKEVPALGAYVVGMMRYLCMAAPGRCQPCRDIMLSLQRLAVWHP